METTTQFLDTAKKDLFEEGFADLGDSTVGEHVYVFEQKGFPFFTEDGLDFLMQHVLVNPAIQSTVEWFFKDQRCVLAHCMRYGAFPGHVETFLAGKHAGQSALAVHLLPKGSGVDYYAKSHLYVFPTAKGPRFTREISATRSTLQEAGCETHDKDFEIGGLVILDGRLGSEIRNRYAITFLFVTEDLLARFNMPPMTLPNSPRLKDKVKEMQDAIKQIRLNFAFEDMGSS